MHTVPAELPVLRHRFKHAVMFSEDQLDFW